MEEGKGVALAILGIVAVVAVFGLVLLFTSAKTGKVYGMADDLAACEEELASGQLSQWCSDFLAEYRGSASYGWIESGAATESALGDDSYLY